MSTLIEAAELCKEVGDFTAAGNLSFSVEQGEALAFPFTVAGRGERQYFRNEMSLILPVFRGILRLVYPFHPEGGFF